MRRGFQFQREAVVAIDQGDIIIHDCRAEIEFDQGSGTGMTGVGVNATVPPRYLEDGGFLGQQTDVIRQNNVFGSRTAGGDEPNGDGTLIDY